ncbi:MAG: AMP-binding protein [Candidatus Eiseniibacteriota bacterium]
MVDEHAAAREGRAQDERWARFVDELRDGRAAGFDEHWTRFGEIFEGRPAEVGPPIAWRPDSSAAQRSHVGRWMAELGIDRFEDFHAWTVAERGRFWKRVVDDLVVLARPYRSVLDPGSDVRDPQWLRGAELNIAESCFRAPGAKPAILSGAEGRPGLTTLTYAELEDQVGRVAAGLLARGFVPGDRVALYLPMTPECVVAYLALVRAGLAAVSIADSFSPAEVTRRLEIAEAKAIVTIDFAVRGGKMIPLYEKVREANAPRAVVIRGGEAAPDLRPGDLHWSDLLRGPGRAPASVGDPRRVVNVLFSSGTTGTPKAIPWTHLTPIKCAMDGRFHQDVHESDVLAWPTNIGWMMGPWLIFAGLMNRATIALYDGAPNGEGFTRFVDEARVSVLGVVPSLVRAWRSSGAMRGRRWRSVRVFSSTGEPSNRSDYLWLMSRTDYRAPVIEYLGGTEIGGGHITGTVVQPASPATFTTPALGISFHVLGDDGRPVERGQGGELFLVPPAIGLSQTLLNADHDRVYFAGCPRGPGGEILRRHGDRFERLAGGWWRAEGRVDDTMNLGGIKVGSLELERALAGHENVGECAAVGVRPGGEGAEKLVVFVVPEGRPDAAALRTELDRRLAGRLNPLFRIHEVAFVDALPRTASNKLMRRELRAAWEREHPGG